MVNPFDVNLDDLQAEQEAANAQKKWLGVAGNALQGIENVPSAYELLYNKKIDRPDIKGTLDSVAQAIPDKWERQKKTYEMYTSAKNAKKQEESDSLAQRTKDPASLESVKARAIAKKLGIDVEDNMTAADLGDLNAVRNKLVENKSSFANQKELKRMDIEGDKEVARLKLDGENKNLPQNVYAAATYGKRLEDANGQIENLINGGYDPTSAVQNIKNKVTPEYFKDDKAKLMEQAQRNFINGVLRRESGSAISQSEFDSGNKQYFPQPGDSPGVLAQKLRNRQVAIAGLRAEGGKAWPRMENNLPPSPMSNTADASGPTPVKKEFNKGLNKTRITYSDGTSKLLDGRQ